jgi:hypothetical protein
MMVNWEGFGRSGRDLIEIVSLHLYEGAEENYGNPQTW